MTVPERLCFSAQLSNCKLATCWHIELSILGLLHLSMGIHLSNSFSCSMKFTTEKHWCPVYTCSYFHGKAFLGKPATVTFGENKDAGSNSDCCMTILLRQPWEELVPWEPTPWHWSKHVKFRPSWLFQKGCLCLHSCQTGNLATCWHIELSILGLLHLSISIHFSNSSSCSMKFFLGLALGESCVASATIETHWYPMSTFSYFRGKAFLGKPATITFGENKDVNSSIKFRL